MPEEPFWALSDSLQLQSSSPSAPTVLLPITVSFSATDNNVSSQLWKNKGMRLQYVPPCVSHMSAGDIINDSYAKLSRV